MGIVDMTKVRFNLEVYDLACLRRALTEYAGLARISTCTQDGYLVCRFEGTGVDSELVAANFANYVIDLMNARA